MPIEKMERKASDNKYLHKDFHNFMNLGIAYIADRYGDDAVRVYLRQFADSYYAPLKQDLIARGPVALMEHFEEIYRLEEALDDVEMHISDDVFVLKVKRCPAVAHMKKRGVKISPLFYETSKTVYETICEGTPFAYTLNRYDASNGAALQHFYRRGMVK